MNWLPSHPIRSILKIGTRIGWLGMLFSSLFLAFITLRYYSFCTDCNFLIRKQDLVGNPIWMAAFYIHITGGLIALVSGPFQFVPSLRRRQIHLHRWIGKAYVAAILFVAGPSGLLMAWYAEGGTAGQLGFTLMAVLWLWSTFQAYDTVIKKDLKGHRDWMVRSFALTFAAVTLRTWILVSTHYFSLDPAMVEATSAWISWLPNLFVAEIIVRFFSKKI